MHICIIFKYEAHYLQTTQHSHITTVPILSIIHLSAHVPSMNFGNKVNKD